MASDIKDRQYAAFVDAYSDTVLGDKNGLLDEGDPDLGAIIGRDKAGFGAGLVRTTAADVPVDADAFNGVSTDQKQFYRAQKALQAIEMGRGASEIGEGRVESTPLTVTDPVSGKATQVAAQSLFFQSIDPPAGVTPNAVMLISPAYQATGRWWTPIADAASRTGNVALSMDHSFAGLSRGEPGRFDGASLAAGIAVMFTRAEEVRAIKCPDGPIRSMGESLGAAALLCGTVLAYNGLIDVPADALPKGDVFVGLVNPYLGKFSTPGASLLGQLTKWLPFSIAAREGYSDVVKDPQTEKRFNHRTALENIQLHPSGLVAAESLIQNVIAGIESGALKLPPNLKFGLLLSEDDASIDRTETERLVKALGDHLVYLKVIPGRDHAIVLNPKARTAIDSLGQAPLDGSGGIDSYRAEKPVGIAFTEDMHGDLRATDGTPVKTLFHLTIDTPDVSAMVTRPDHPGTCNGYIDIFGERCDVKDGEFELFPRNAQTGQIEMRYRLRFQTADGTPYFLTGTKYAHDDPGFDVWADTTTLFTKVTKGDQDGPVVLDGTLRLNALDLAKQLTTFKATGSGGVFAHLKAFTKFFGFFGKTLFDTHVAPKIK